jgi:hypothetical protein
MFSPLTNRPFLPASLVFLSAIFLSANSAEATTNPETSINLIFPNVSSLPANSLITAGIQDDPNVLNNTAGLYRSIAMLLTSPGNNSAGAEVIGTHECGIVPGTTTKQRFDLAMLGDPGQV